MRTPTYDSEFAIDVAELAPQVTWGTNPEMVVSGHGPRARSRRATPMPTSGSAAERALTYMGLEPGTAMQDIAVDRVFIGSCTNARIEDLRAAAAVVAGKQVHPGVRALVVPGSATVKRLAEEEGLDRVFRDAGFEWRRAGCSMCLGMNPDVLAAGERCASTSNRNFEGRQGRGGRTHLVSPQLAAATAIAGHFVDPRELAHGMKPFRRVSGPVAVLDRADVDTDQIIPKQFLKRIERTGFGEFLFFDWRLDEAGSRGRLRTERPGVRGREDPDRRRELRLRLLARARRLGAPGLRLRGRDRAVVRGHLRDQLSEDRPRHDRPAGGRAPPADRLGRRGAGTQRSTSSGS